jgi:hypothetical protein
MTSQDLSDRESSVNFRAPARPDTPLPLRDSSEVVHVRPKCLSKSFSASARPASVRTTDLALPWVQNPPALVQEVHHAPVESFPDAGAIVERQCEKTEGDLGELLGVEPIRDFGVLHGMGPGPHNGTLLQLRKPERSEGFVSCKHEFGSSSRVR